MECYVKTVGDVDIDTELAVLGTNDFRMLYSSNGELDVYSSPHIVLCLHNNLMRLLRRALKYIQRGIHVPLSDDVKVRLDSAIGEADDEKQRAAEDDKFDRDWDKAATAATVVKFVQHKSLVGSEEEEKEEEEEGATTRLQLHGHAIDTAAKRQGGTEEEGGEQGVVRDLMEVDDNDDDELKAAKRVRRII